MAEGGLTQANGTRLAQRTVLMYSVLLLAVPDGSQLNGGTYQMALTAHIVAPDPLFTDRSRAVIAQRTAAFTTSMRSTVLIRRDLGMPVIVHGAK